MFKKILTIIIGLVIMIALIGSCNQKAISTSSRTFNGETVKVGVLLSSYDNEYIFLIKKGLEEIKKENKYKVQYFFFDGEKNQAVQNKDLHTVLREKEVDLILLNLVNQDGTKYAIDRIKENNIPVIMFGGADIQTIKAYNKAYWIGTDVIEGAKLQGEIIIDLWNNKSKEIDKNKDNIIQYIMLQGSVNDIYAIERTKHSILAINNSGIKTQELASIVCNWSEKEAENATKSLLLRFGNDIEMIIANNDSMAIGAIKALQEHGYNNGDERRTIPVVGFDGIQEAQDLIKKGLMAGTVIQDPHDSSKALCTVGMNLLHNRDPIEGTEYKFGDARVEIIISHKGKMSNIKQRG